jgi:hypothetical protein
VIVHNLNVGWSCLALRPTETDAPLAIDPYGVLPGARSPLRTSSRLPRRARSVSKDRAAFRIERRRAACCSKL